MTLLSEFWKAGGFKKAGNLALFLELVKSMMPSVAVNRQGEKVYSSGNAGAVLVALIFFILMYAIYRYSLQHGASNGTPVRAVWVWDNSPALSPAKAGKFDFSSSKVIASPGEFLPWAKKRGVNELWLDINSYTGSSAQLVPLLSGAAKQGMPVQLMCFTSGVKLASANVATLPKLFGIIEGIGDKSLWPIALQSNLEAGLTGKADASEAFKAHQTLKSELGVFNTKHGTTIRLVASVFFWWINYEAKNAPVVGGMTYGEALLKLGYDVTVQDYRKPDPNYSRKPAIAWCKMAAVHGQSAKIGMLVGPNNAPSNYAYFDKMGDLDSDMQALAASCNQLEGFAGMAVHDALWYGTYAP